MDKENIKKAFDLFVDDKFTEAKEVLKSELKSAKDEFISKKTGIKLVSEAFGDFIKISIDNLDKFKGYSLNKIHSTIFYKWCENQDVVTIEDVKIKGNELWVLPYYTSNVQNIEKVKKDLQKSFDEWYNNL